jgi:hypothetical protein
MPKAQQPAAPAPTCRVWMSDLLPCGRPTYLAPGSMDPNLPCIMHCRETTKDPVQFRQEIDAILAGKSAHHRPKDRFDFTRFVFPKANFSGATFAQMAYFRRATFTQDAYFSAATFTQEADFGRATFAHHANFFGATFTQKADFRRATFAQQADFASTEFRRPEQVRFNRVNQQKGAPSLRARFVNCRVEGVQFVDVNWHRQGGRMVLQDELDLTDGTIGEAAGPPCELVAIAYRQLVNNFEKERAYDLAEDCKVGAMEMKRLDPKNFLFAKWLESYYKKWRWLRWLGENVSAASLYRWTSRYGTSYTRALLVLVRFLVFFALLFALPWSAIQREKPSLPPQPVLGVLPRLGAGFFHSLETAAFQRDSLYSVPTRFGRFASILETILVPAQVALFLLALRRRFRH